MTRPVTQTGLHRITWQPSGRRYALSIPPAYTGETAVPLALALHWGGPPYPFRGADLLAGLMVPALGELGAVIAAPDCPAEGWDQPVSEALVLDLLDHLAGQYRLDPGRTLITGYSMGGIGTWHLAARHQERFATALPISARPGAESAGVAWRIPLYVIHSRADQVFPLAPTEEAVAALRRRGASVELVVLDGVDHFDTGRFVPPLRAAVPWVEGVWGQHGPS